MYEPRALPVGKGQESAPHISVFIYLFQFYSFPDLNPLTGVEVGVNHAIKFAMTSLQHGDTDCRITLSFYVTWRAMTNSIWTSIDVWHTKHGYFVIKLKTISLHYIQSTVSQYDWNEVPALPAMNFNANQWVCTGHHRSASLDSIHKVLGGAIRGLPGPLSNNLEWLSGRQRGSTGFWGATTGIARIPRGS